MKLALCPVCTCELHYRAVSEWWACSGMCDWGGAGEAHRPPVGAVVVDGSYRRSSESRTAADDSLVPTSSGSATGPESVTP